jgi:hypothetical protein
MDKKCTGVEKNTDENFIGVEKYMDEMVHKKKRSSMKVV